MLLSLAEFGKLKGPLPMGLFKDGSVKGYVQREKRLVVSGINQKVSLDAIYAEKSSESGPMLPAYKRHLMYC